MPFFKKNFLNFFKRKSKGEQKREVKESKDKKDKKPKEKPKPVAKAKEKLSPNELRWKKEGNKRHKKNKVASLTRKGDRTGIQKIAKRNSAENRRKKNKHLRFNKDHPDRIHRDRIRETRRKALGREPYKK